MPEKGKKHGIYAEQLANLMASAALKKRGAGLDGVSQAKLAKAIMSRPAFEELENDPRAIKLLRKGRGSELITLYLLKEHKLTGPRGPYARPASMAAADAEFLKAASDSFGPKGQAQGAPAEMERESKLLAEFKKQIDHARTMAEQGLPLDEKDAASLVVAAKRYNDGGTSIPGGRREAPYSKQAMCVLSRYMPKEEFAAYCAGVNKSRGAKLPSSRGHVEPSDYTRELMTGAARPARELMAEAGRRLANKISVDNCAVAAAIHKLSGGNPNAVISRERLEAETALLKKPGSAFMQVMSDETARGRFAQLAASGGALRIGRSITGEAKRYSALAAKWQMDQAMKAAASGKGGKQTAAQILAAKELAASGDAASGVTNEAFREKVKSVMESPAFKRFSERYDADPEYRARLDRELASGDANGVLENELAPSRKASEAERVKETPSLTRS